MKAIIFKLNYLYSQVLIEKIREQVLWCDPCSNTLFLLFVFLPLMKKRPENETVDTMSAAVELATY